MTTIAKISIIGRGQCRHVLFFTIIMFLLSAAQLDMACAATGIVDANYQGPGRSVSHPNLPNDPQFSGVIYVLVNGNRVPMYCADLELTTGPGLTYNSGAYVTDPSLIFILNNYYPTTSNPAGTDYQKAAAVQLAIWNYTNSLDISSGGLPSIVFNPARDIIAAANQPTLNTYSLALSPASATNEVSTQHTITATLKLNQNPSSGKTITFQVQGANTASGTVVTASNGIATFSYTGSNAGEDTITATAEVDQPGGLLWVNADGKQPLVQAVTYKPSQTAKKTWVETNCISGYKRDDKGTAIADWKITVTGNGQTWEATTDANGFWQVCDLVEGTYTVCEEDKSGWLKISPVDCHTVNLAGEDQTDINFVNAKISCLSGHKLDDKGTALSGWAITVSGNGQTWEATTDANGFWQVCDLVDGTYTVCEVQKPGWIKVSPADCHSVALAGTDITNLDFVNARVSCLSGFKRDESGSGLADWKITVSGNGQTWDATTDANGFWQVCNLRDGAYTVCEEDKPGWLKISPVDCHTVNLAGEDQTDINFVNAKISCLSGHKLDDKGTALSDWKITVTGNGQTWDATTDANGFWQVCDLVDGTYTVCEEDKPGWVKVSPADCHSVALAGTDITNLDFVNARVSCLSGFKRDESGSGLADWKITVSGNGQTWDATTDANGFWQVCDLVDGTYTVCEEQKPGWVKVSPAGCHTVTLAGEDQTGLNFINRKAVGRCISGYKRDDKGTAIADWKITVTGNGQTWEATTDVNGFWQVCDLVDGTYTVCEEDKPGWVKVSPVDCHTVNLAGEDQTDIDFVNAKISCLSGHKLDDKGTALSDWKITVTGNGQTWETTTDANGFWQVCDLVDGAYTICEEDKPGWVKISPADCHTVNLAGEDQTDIDFVNAKISCLSGHKLDDMGIALSDWKITVSGNGQTWEATTDANGFWQVCDLRDGAYTVCEVQKPGWIKVSPADCHSVALAGRDITNLDFVNAKVSCLSGFKRDESGSGLADWKITVSGNGQTRDATTDANGFWQVCDLVDGTYTVCEVQKPGWIKVSPAGCHIVTLAGEDQTGLNFINRKAIGRCISGYKRDDRGTAIADWKITVTGNGQTWEATTDVNGFWQVCDLVDGTYTVCEEDKPGWVKVSPVDCHTVNLAGEDQTDIDFVNAKISCLSGHKLDDKGTALSDWKITVTGNGQTWDATTDANGFWQVCNLRDGAYTVCEVQKPGWEQISPEDCHTVNLAGADQTDIDFINKQGGFQPELCLSGHVFDKATGQGLEDWSVIITDSEGNAQTVKTDEDGYWRICGLKDDTYTVCEMTEFGWKQVSPTVPTKCYEVKPELPDKGDLDFYNERLGRVTKTADRSQAERGEEIAYTITICNDDQIPMKNVEVKDIFSIPVELIEPTQGIGREVRWMIDTIPAGTCQKLYVTARVAKSESKFDMGQSVSGTGFVNVHNDYSTSKEGFGLNNCVYVRINDKETISDCAMVSIGEKLGTEIKTREYGSGIYATDEMINYSAKNSSIEILKDVDAVYNPTTFRLPNSRNLNYSTLWIEKNKAKNWLTGTSITEEYTFAKRIKRDGYIKVDKNESTLNVDSEIDGQAHLGFLKKSEANGTAKSKPIFEMSEDYAGKFSILENIEEYGMNVESNKSTEGVGYVAADKRISNNQRTFEHGTGSYRVEEQIDTQSRYMAKDIKVVSAPASYTYTPLTGTGQTLKWKEGMWSKSDNSQFNGGGLSYTICPGNEGEGFASYIGQEFSSLDYLEKETVARGLNEMDTNASFSGVADFRVVIGRNSGSAGTKLGSISGNRSDNGNIIDIDERYVGEFDITKKILLTGTSKYNVPHIYVAKEGVKREVKDEGLNKTFVDYTILVQNDGNRALGPIYVSDIFPLNTEFINASLKPTSLTSCYANWTLLHLPVGGYSTINLRLNVTENAADDLVNRVSAAAGYNGNWIFASNYHVLETSWLKCCAPRISLQKSAVVSALQPGLVSYRLAFENPGGQVMAARLTDYLPEGMRLYSSSIDPLEYEKNTRVVTWAFNAVKPGEVVFVDFVAQAVRDGSFTNAARLEGVNVDGSGIATTEASAAVYVEGTSRSPYYPGYSSWQPPDWDFRGSEEGLQL